MRESLDKVSVLCSELVLLLVVTLLGLVTLMTVSPSCLTLTLLLLCRKPILDLVPRKLHERSPIFLGSKEDVEDVMAVIAKHK